ncbi:MAG: hypothetical protein COX62_00400 [Deltaproteobacteria bacterium CG_4_10_14_0_2_um_filter_43_8]|nr:MAG: hypothetical protein COV43_09675 [Deltaproteobacteria bacterium CG11_big_fil_rev_8_21_14_0_20_42_23]PJA22239.1 MAG: hypothetical protein COX62_00400 [Deltaproteobacteria bacterium CG_4_10_14_0_2_um_filter_43_8]PJC64312.1 MAG: hypothetical protein CO021_04730 [Deltaproteobacteria bacterium CG_4_9_14_0_2_um_filter_42_21]
MIFKSSKRKRVGLFGGSFDPPHLGHLSICTWLLERNVVDEIWVIPCFEHPFGKKLTEFKLRYQMCLFAFNSLGNHHIKVSDIERELGGTSRTLRTIRHLQATYPEVQFQLIAGSDNEAASSRWHQFDIIKELVPVVFVPRGEDSEIPNIASTDIRQRISKNQKFRDLVNTEVAVYIITNGLYS